MRPSIQKLFGGLRARALVLDDDDKSRTMLGRTLRERGFDVVSCKDGKEFFSSWLPGMFDVIVSDWDLTHDRAEAGNKVLEAVRKRDWDVPFVLLSGMLAEAELKADVLSTLLNSGGARFVERGNGGFQDACEAAEDLLERRDPTLLRIILALRAEALEGISAKTSSGTVSAAKALESIVARPDESHEAERPLTNEILRRRLEKQ